MYVCIQQLFGRSWVQFLSETQIFSLYHPRVMLISSLFSMYIDLSNNMPLSEVRPSKKKSHVSRPDFYKKESGRVVFFLLFIISYCMLSLPSPRDTLELLGQILIKRNISYWLNTSLFNFDTHKGLTVKIYSILVCTQQQWALQVTPVGFWS